MEETVHQRIVVPFNGHIIGEGFNSDTGERIGTALTAASIGEDKTADGQTATFSFQMVTSQESLESSLHISAEIDARYAVYSGGAKFDFAKNNAVNSSSTYILASCTIQNALRSGIGFKPNDDAGPILRAGDQDLFTKTYGDRFTQALQTGGEFHAIVRVTSSSSEHQSKISSSLHGEMQGLASGSFKAALEEADHDKLSHSEVDIEILQVGGQGLQVKMPGADADKIRDLMNNFAQSVHDHPVAYEAQVVSYNILALPGPSALELDDKRRVLEDCQARKQKYWSAISQIDLYKSNDGPLIFANLPSASDLDVLQSDFRRSLNDLMAHARAVSTGSIPPTLFVPQSEPVLPTYDRKAATTFAMWWVRRDDPTLTLDEHTLVHKLGNASQKLMSVPLNGASPEAVQSAAAGLTQLDVSSATGRPALTTIVELPKMIASPLRELNLSQNKLIDLNGVEPFSRLERLYADDNDISDITSLAALGGLQSLQLRGNRIADIIALAGLANLKTLLLEGNEITSLEPIRSLKALEILMLGSLPMVAEGTTAVFRDNPIHDARALSALQMFDNPFTTSDRISVTFTELPTGIDLDGAAGQQLRALAADSEAVVRVTGVASRVGDSSEFSFVTEGGTTEPLRLVGLGGGRSGPIVAGLWFPNRRKGGCLMTLPSAQQESLGLSQLAQKLLSSEGPGWIALGFFGFSWELLVQAKPL